MADWMCFGSQLPWNKLILLAAPSPKELFLPKGLANSPWLLASLAADAAFAEDCHLSFRVLELGSWA